ncbi:ataxin-2 homolog isoform X2 [Teleopsis dalmanni]|uniref:ataxin-2 homolog isoform X2 n=1 Tax=Teleopsis dalmanni TaxID=139649 RepID=UPI0018CE96D0|nr:ataxin-2 homolog isoform X2 [Teleopsis dalmanni]
MNNNKRKNRPSVVTRYQTDNRQPKPNPSPQGVYSNAFFMHAATALVGNVVQLRLRSGNIYEGVFRTFSSSFDVALELPTCIKSLKNGPDEGKNVPNFMIFPYDTVVSITAKDFDSNYATVGAFQTDAAISEKCTRFEEKELEPWDGSGANGDIDIELDDAANGWDPNEMFRKNENQFGVQSTFDDSLTSYTVQLDKKDSEEYKEAEARAEKLAAEIESNPSCRERLDLENGDEEALFAAVERPILESERDRERERERDAERDRTARVDRARELQKERDRELERDKRYFEQTPTERYISKQTRNNTGPPPPVVMTSNASLASSSRGHERDLISDRTERSTNSISAGNVPHSAQSSINMNVKSSLPQSPIGVIQENSNKYGGSGSSLIKRKPVSQNNKVVRNTPPPNNSIGGNNSNGNNNLSQNNNGSCSKGSNYQSLSMQNQSYQNYPPILHGQSQYRNQNHMGMPPKINGESNISTGKPLPQRSIRQYQNTQSNTSNNYGESQNQIQANKQLHSTHVTYHVSQTSGNINNSVSPPLQTSGSSVSHAHNQNNVVPCPPNQGLQTQRQIRNRETQLQDLRQFGQDFQLAGNNSSPPQQTQQPLQQQHLSINKSVAGHQPQPSASPPQQSPHVSHIQHVPQHHSTQHHVTVAQHVHAAPQTHYISSPIVQQQQQHEAPTHVQQQQQQKHNDNVIHSSKGPQHISNSVSQQQSTQQQGQIVQELPQQPQGLYHSVPPSTQQKQQISPVVMTSIENSQHTTNAMQPQQTQQQQGQQQQQQQTQQISKADPLVSSNITQTTSTNTGNTSLPVSEKSPPPTNISVSTTVVKKHVLNPSAKPFTPRSPSTPNPSRPHTPQTPIPMTGIYTTGAHVAATNPIYVMPQQPTTFPPHPQQPRMRRSNFAPMASSHMHVSATAATGQPLLATTQIPQFIHYQQTPHAPPFQSQTFGPMVRMFPEQPPQPLQFITQTPPSTTPSPGQPHQSFHPPPQPSPAGGGPQPAYAQTQPAYQIVCPVIHPQTQLVQSPYYQTPQHPPQSQQFQILMQQHPAQ